MKKINKVLLLGVAFSLLTIGVSKLATSECLCYQYEVIQYAGITYPSGYNCYRIGSGGEHIYIGAVTDCIIGTGSACGHFWCNVSCPNCISWCPDCPPLP